MYADNLAMQIIRAPGQFDVIVGENTFGDIISDEAAVLAGSLGMLPVGQPCLPSGERRQAQAGRLSLRAHPRQRAGHLRAGHRQPHRHGAEHCDDAALLPGDGRGGRRDRARAVDGVLAEGYRTPDIAADGGDVVGTTRMGDVIAGLGLIATGKVD